MIIVPSNRDEIRLRAIRATSEILMRTGDFSVRMDDVAQELSVSKRTLYEIFGNKEELLIECMKIHVDRVSRIIEDEMRREDDVLSVFIKHLEIIINESRENDHARFSDMDKYPKLKKLCNEHLCEMTRNLREFMLLGVRQGVFRDDLNMDVIMKAFSAMGKMAKEESGKGEFRYEELIDGTMVVLLRGIATPKGMEKLEKYRNKNK